MLGFTRLKFSRRKTPTNLTICALMIATVLVLFAMIDSFYLHLLDTAQRHDQQNCVMSYAYPTFTEITHTPNSTFSTKYRLYLYREGHLDKSNQLYGVPALFIPGQAGSHKQVRSLASTTTHLYHDGKSQQNIDYFTVDLNEELSALSGQTLLDQAEYMNQVIERILTLYQNQAKKPTSVIIIGHSMGGLVARTMFMLPNYVPNSITNIITLATPHMAAPLLLDATIYETYKKLAKFWAENRFDNLILISIAGGSLDNIVHSDGVNTASVIPATHGFTTYTTSIPGVWTGADHMAILWCNQLIRILASTLLEIINVTTVEDRMRIYRYNLLDGRDSSIISNQPTTEINPAQLEYRTLTDPTRPILLDATKKTVTLIPVSLWKNTRLLTNIDRSNDNCWSLALCEDTNNCKYVVPRVAVLPSASAKDLINSAPFRILEVDASNNSSFIGIIQHCAMPKDYFMQLYHTVSTVHDKTIWQILLTNGYSFLVGPKNTMHLFPFIRNSLFAFDVNVVSITDQQQQQQNLYKPMMKQTINNSEVKYYRNLDAGQSDRITFHQEPDTDKHHGLSLEFFIDNRQSMNIEIKLDWYGTLGRCVLRYGAILVNFLWISSLVILLAQANTYAVNGKCEFVAYPVALVQCLKGPFMQLAALLIAAVTIVSLSSVGDLSNIHAFATRYMLFGSSDWLFGGLLILAFVLSIGLNAIVWFLVSVLLLIFSLPMRLLHFSGSSRWASSSVTFTQFLVHSSIAVGLLSFLPSAVVFSLYFSIWVFMTSSARNAAQSDLPLFQNVYRYRQSWLIFLVSLLPYHIPKLIVFIKNVVIGWTYKRPESIFTIIQDAPALTTLVFLVTVGKNPNVLDSRYLKPIIFVMNLIVIYQMLFGFLHPFVLSLFV